jgi:hypothetical protein
VVVFDGADEMVIHAMRLTRRCAGRVIFVLACAGTMPA